MMRFARAAAAATALALALTACSGGESADPADDETTPAEGTDPTDEETTDEVEVPEGRTEITFWHAMSAGLGETVDALVAEYNDSQEDVFVVATFQGTYDDTYNALLAAFETGSEPNIVQNFDLASQTMFDTGRLVPAHELMASDGFDDSVFVPAVKDYYSDENGMVAMAFNSSTPIVYFNKTMLEDAGVTAPDGESWTFTEFKAACDDIQAAGTEFCVALGQVGWYYEQILANSGGLYFDNDNGRTARAENVKFNEGVGVEVFDFLTSLYAEEYAPNLGNTWTDTDSVFLAGQSAMLFDSTAGAKGLQEQADFEIGTMFIPYADSAERNGVVIGGAALWLIDSGDDATNLAAWDFMKFLASKDAQVAWHTGTGYFPVRTDIEGNADLEAFWEANPNFVTAINQLETTQTTKDGGVNYAVLGGRAGPFPAIRRLIVEAYSDVLDNGMTPQEALDKAATAANQELSDYNSFFAG